MDYQNLQNLLRNRLSLFSAKVQAACAQNLTDLPKLSENLTTALLRELMGFRDLGNLNAEQKKDYPALDSTGAIHDKRLGSLVKIQPVRLVNIQTAPTHHSATASAEA
jgi:hypothetical protein